MTSPHTFGTKAFSCCWFHFYNSAGTNEWSLSTTAFLLASPLKSALTRSRLFFRTERAFSRCSFCFAIKPLRSFVQVSTVFSRILRRSYGLSPSCNSYFSIVSYLLSMYALTESQGAPKISLMIPFSSSLSQARLSGRAIGTFLYSTTGLRFFC